MVRGLAAIGLMSLGAFAAAPASLAADVAMGTQLARQWCAQCHVIGPAPQSGAVQQGPPSLAAVAQGGKTGDELRTFLARPHGAMPDLALTRSEIDDLLAYIATLR